MRVVGLGPGDVEHLTARTQRLINDAAVVRLRTRVHPAAAGLDAVASYDELYERATSFDELYFDIVEDLVSLAASSSNGEVVYVVPGSPVVAERTVELLRARREVDTVCEPAVSVIDVACAVLGRDPMSEHLRVLDALDSVEPFRGPGPLLILQTYAPEVLATVADRMPPATPVTVLHHLGLADQRIVATSAGELTNFDDADHLTSLWVDGLRTAGEATDDLVDFMRRLRRECPWDQEQTHASLTRHLLEESYEALDALEHFVAVADAESITHVEEELGDLLFQIVFHAELADEEGLFNFATIADGVRDKLIGRHPHVFGDTVVSDADEVARRWEVLKREEKGRQSVTDGIASQLPALTLYQKLLAKAALVDPELARTETAHVPSDLDSIGRTDPEEVALALWGDALSALVGAANEVGVDLEGVLRQRANDLRRRIWDAERLGSGAMLDE